MELERQRKRQSGQNDFKNRSASTWTTSFVYNFTDEGWGNLVSEYDQPGETYYHTYDTLGPTDNLISDGVAAHAYRIFGAQTDPNTTDTDFNFVGRQNYYNDSERDLYFTGLHYYSPDMGRFISNDPKGFEAGDANTYRYVGNNPVNKTDPSGEADNVSILSGLEDQGVPAAKFKGELRRVPVSATGVSDDDTKAAWSKFKEENPALKITDKEMEKFTWHHKKFNPASQEFEMVLVDRNAHALLGHEGAYNEYLNWVSEVTQNEEKLSKLTPKEAAGIFKALKRNETLRSRIGGRLEKTFKALVNVEKKAGKVTFLSEGELVAQEIIASKEGRSWFAKVAPTATTMKELTARWGSKALRGGGTVLRWTAEKAPLIGLGFAILDAGKTFAQTGNVGQTLESGVKEGVNNLTGLGDIKDATVSFIDYGSQFLPTPAGVTTHRFHGQDLADLLQNTPHPSSGTHNAQQRII